MSDYPFLAHAIPLKLSITEAQLLNIDGHMTQNGQSEYSTPLATMIGSEVDMWPKQDQSEPSLKFDLLETGGEKVCLLDDLKL